MKLSSFPIRSIAGVVLAAFVVSGCGPSPLLHVGNAVFNAGQDLPSDMVNRHLAGIVAFDETWAGNYNRVARNALYVQGVVEGTPEYQFRAVRVNLSHTDDALWVKKGALVFPTAAIVPDHLPALKAGDVVEIRQTGTWRTVENFSSRKEGNIVVRLLCRKTDSNYQFCLERGPQTGVAQGVGPTGTSYPSSVAGYGFSFSPFYSPDGKVLRVLPR